MTQRLPAGPLAGLLSVSRQLARTLGLPVPPSFGVEGLAGMRSGLGYQSINVGAQTFESVRVTWNGQVQNTGNAPIGDLVAFLVVRKSADQTSIRSTDVLLPTIAPGAATPISLGIDLLSSDTPGSFYGEAYVRTRWSETVLAQQTSGILGTINPMSAPVPAPAPAPAPAPTPELTSESTPQSIWTAAMTAAMERARAGPDFVIDGAFDINPFPEMPGGTYFAPQTMNAWFVSKGSVDFGRNGEFPVYTANVDLSGYSAGAIYQDIPTIPGRVYRLTFDLSGNWYSGPDVKEMQLHWGGQLVATYSISQQEIWRHVELVVTATGPMSRLEFESMTNTAFGPVIDNVHLTLERS